MAHETAEKLPAEKLDRIKRIEELKDAATYGSPELSCDVIMKGGITSGVVYPLAVAELATKYRFSNIGGTSAGAIAAAAAAAAAYEGTGEGYAKLAALPERLGSELLDIFRPQRKAKRLFRLIAVATTKAKGFAGAVKNVRLLAAVMAFVGSIRGFVMIGSAIAAAVGVGWVVIAEIGDDWIVGAATLACVGVAATLSAQVKPLLESAPSWIRLPVTVLLRFLPAAVAVAASIAWGGAFWFFVAWLALATVGVLVAVVAAIGSEAIAVLAANHYGLVGGSALNTEPSPVAPLSEWLDNLLRDVSGGTDPLCPLTFHDLANGPNGGVNLALLTTCVSKGRTYYSPWDFGSNDDESEWFFDPLELRQCLPDNIVAYLCEPNDLDRRRTALDQLAAGGRPDGSAGQDVVEQAVWPLRPLPPPEKLPVLLSTRMSLSFPVLISAVPLRAIDWSLHRNQQAKDLWEAWDGTGEPPTQRLDAEQCWFSDGGIISNFPVHLFDSMLPNHPTFGINLRGYHPDYESNSSPDVPEAEKVYRPTSNQGGRLETWQRWPQTGIGAVGGFVSAIKNTIQNWSDNDQMRVPGYRDRVVHVSHDKAEGGLNLAMPNETINALGRRGHAAAENLIDAFADPDSEVTTNWQNHKWVRFRSAMALLGAEIQAIRGRYDEADPTGTETYRELVRLDDPPSYDGIQGQRHALIEFVEGVHDGAPAAPGLIGASDALTARAQQFKGAKLSANAPSPTPELRITPGHRDNNS